MAMVLEIIKPWIFPEGQPALKENHSVPMTWPSIISTYSHGEVFTDSRFRGTDIDHTSQRRSDK